METSHDADDERAPGDADDAGTSARAARGERPAGGASQRIEKVPRAAGKAATAPSTCRAERSDAERRAP